MTDNVPQESADTNEIGADPDDRTVVRPRRKAAPAVVPAAEPVVVAAPVAAPAPVEVAAPVAAPAAVAAPGEAAAPVAVPAAVAVAAPVAAPVPVAESAPAPVATPYVAPVAAAPAQPQQPRRLALISMILGIGGLVLSFFGVGFFVVVAAVITGHIASRRQHHAKALWLTGIIAGYVGIAFSAVYGVIWANYFLHYFGILS